MIDGTNKTRDEDRKPGSDAEQGRPIPRPFDPRELEKLPKGGATEPYRSWWVVE